MLQSHFLAAPATMPLSFLGSEIFFRDYWKKRPLCLRQALPGFQSPISADGLAGLACESRVESRLVLEHGKTPWELINGPFTAKHLQKLPQSHWTLLVQAVNHWVPEVQQLLNYFTFLPSYCLDDIMVSYAPEQGSVGPHFDYYDVFILQGTGKRHWQLGQFCSPATTLMAETSLAILPEFLVSEEYILEPGDILYIPQQQAHWCIAKEAGLSYSIGFRTPAHSELLNSLCSEWMSQLDESLRLTIAPKSAAENPAKLGKELYQEVQQMLHKLVQEPRQILEWLGCHLTEPKYPELEKSGVSKKSLNIDKQLAKYSFLRHEESSRFAYYEDEENHTISLFVDGQCLCYQTEVAPFIIALCGHHELACAQVNSYIQLEGARTLLQTLLQEGVVYFK